MCSECKEDSSLMQAMVLLQRNGIYATRWIWANNALRGYKASFLLLQLLDSYSLSKQASEWKTQGSLVGICTSLLRLEWETQRESYRGGRIRLGEIEFAIILTTTSLTLCCTPITVAYSSSVGPPIHCVLKLGFMRTLIGKEDATVDIKSVVIFIMRPLIYSPI